MAREVFVRTRERIAYGDRLLVRGCRVRKADEAIANATAIKPMHWAAYGHYAPGDIVVAAMDDGLGVRDLHALANGPIMDASEIYLPAGKLSMAETIARERQQILPAHDPERTDDDRDR